MLTALQKNPGSTAAGFAALITFDRTSTPAAPKLSATIDQNGDGRLDISGEVVPFLDRFFADFDRLVLAGQAPYGPQYTTTAQLPTIISTIGSFTRPVLLLQGANDANVAPESAREIDRALVVAGTSDHTLLIFPGLGHSLGPAATVYEDSFQPIATEPMAILVSWLERRFGEVNDPDAVDVVWIQWADDGDGWWLWLSGRRGAPGCSPVGPPLALGPRDPVVVPRATE